MEKANHTRTLAQKKNCARHCDVPCILFSFANLILRDFFSLSNVASFFSAQLTHFFLLHTAQSLCAGFSVPLKPRDWSISAWMLHFWTAQIQCSTAVPKGILWPNTITTEPHTQQLSVKRFFFLRCCILWYMLRVNIQLTDFREHCRSPGSIILLRSPLSSVDIPSGCEWQNWIHRMRWRRRQTNRIINHLLSFEKVILTCASPAYTVHGHAIRLIFRYP